MDWPTVAVDGVALAILVGWNVLDHIRVGRLKDEQIATLKAHLAQVAELTYKGANDQIEALEQLHKRELDILRRQHAAELELARYEEDELVKRRPLGGAPARLREDVQVAEGELAELEKERQALSERAVARMMGSDLTPEALEAYERGIRGLVKP